MYKKQMIFQKVVCLLVVIAAAAVFVYSLGIITDIYDSLYSTMRNPNNHADTKVPGSIIYYDMQDFNRAFVKVGIGLILLACLLFITNTSTRRKYYIGNYLVIGANVAANVAAAIWAHTNIEAFKAQFLTTVDFEALKTYAEKWHAPYTESTFWFDVHYGVFALALLGSLLLIVNLIWKIIMMKNEKRLIEAGRSVSA